MVHVCVSFLKDKRFRTGKSNRCWRSLVGVVSVVVLDVVVAVVAVVAFVVVVEMMEI